MGEFIGGVLIFGGMFNFFFCGLLFGQYVADQKGRSALEGFLFGFLLGPLGLIIVACLPTMTAEERKRRADHADARRAELIRTGASVPPPNPTTVGAARAAEQRPPVPTRSLREPDRKERPVGAPGDRR